MCVNLLFEFRHACMYMYMIRTLPQYFLADPFLLDFFFMRESFSSCYIYYRAIQCMHAWNLRIEDTLGTM